MTMTQSRKIRIGAGIGLAGILFFVVAAIGVKSKRESFREYTIERGNLEVTILATGWVQPENRLDVKLPVGGRVDEVLVHEGDKIKRGQVLAWMSSTERATLIDSARSKGPEEMKKWQELIRPIPILAPIDGMLIQRNVEPGQVFAERDIVLVMSDRFTVKAQLDETDLAAIHLNQRCDIRLDAYPNEAVPARVDKIAFDARSYNNVTVYIVDILPAQAPEFMRSGMTANVTFFVDSKKNIPLVSNEFVRYEHGHPVVLVRDDAKEEPITREIQLGASDGRVSEVLGGVTEGEVVLLPKPKEKEHGANPFATSSRPRAAGNR